MTETAASGGESGTYGGVVGAFPYAFRASDSRIFRVYVVVSALVILLLSFLFVVALVIWIAATIGGSELVTLSRTFLVVVWLFVIAPVLAPVLLVARRHRRGTLVSEQYDRALALSGFAFFLSLYLGLVASAPPDSRSAPPAAIAPIVEFLYGLPQIAGLVFPVVGALLVLVVHRLLRE